MRTARPARHTASCASISAMAAISRGVHITAGSAWPVARRALWAATLALAFLPGVAHAAVRPSRVVDHFSFLHVNAGASTSTRRPGRAAHRRSPR